MNLISISMTKYFVFFLIIFSAFYASAQPGWNWPEDPSQDKMSKNQQAYYKVLMAQEKYPEALSTQYWLFANNPDLNPSIYKDGAKIIEKILEGGVDSEREAVLKDSLLWMFDMRMKYFPDDRNAALDRKAYTAFKMYYKQSSYYPMLHEIYEELFKSPATDISNFNLTPYMTLATYYYKSKPSEMTPEKVLSIHETISDVITEKSKVEGNTSKLQKEQNKIDAFLSSLDDILNCDYIEQSLVSKLKENPNDLNTAKKVFSYSLKAKCTDQPYFLTAGSTLFNTEPTFPLAKALADKYYQSDSYQQALNFYKKAEELAGPGQESFQALYGQAMTYSKMGNKVQARAMARQALSKKTDAKEAYNLIGNLYYTSYDDCKGGESRVADRSVFIAAYNMYQKSGNTEQMEASKQQFPSIEDIFGEGKEEGQIVTVGCWINESVQLQRR